MTDGRYPLRRVEGLLARARYRRGEGAKMCPESRGRAGRKTARGRGRCGEGGERGNDIYYHPLCREYHCGVG